MRRMKGKVKIIFKEEQMREEVGELRLHLFFPYVMAILVVTKLKLR